MKSSTLASLVISSLLACSADSVANEGLGAGARRRGEVAVMAGAAGDSSGTIGPIGALSMGWHITRAFEVEPSIVVAIGDAVPSLNLNVNVSGGRLVPYVSGGLGVCVHGAGFFNAGGGLKVAVRDRLSLRGEFRYFSFGEDGTTYGSGLFLAGVAYSF